MKSTLFKTLILSLLLSLGVVGCDDKNEKPNEQTVFTGAKDLSHTDCKTATKSSERKEYLELSEADKYLAIKHINAVFNCCPGELLVTSEVRNDTIFINETEKEAGCKCICPYDLEYKVGALDYGKYHVILSDSKSYKVKFSLGGV